MPSLLLFGLVAGLYAAWSNSGFLYDDRVLILKHDRPESIAEVVDSFRYQLLNRDPDWPKLPYYRPIPRVTYKLQKYWHGDNAQPYHLFNVVLMALTAVAVYALFCRPVFGIPRVAAWWGALLFGWHPIAACCAYPISARETMLPALVIVLGITAWLRGGAVGRAAAVVWFVVGLMSKEQAVVLPALCFAADLLRLTPDPPGLRFGRWIVRYAPYAAIVVGYAALRAHVFGTDSQHTLAALLSPLGPMYSLLYALQTTFAPFHGVIYEPALHIWWSVPRLCVAGAAVLGLAVLAICAGRGIRTTLGFWCGWFVLALLPTSNILLQEANFAERYVFLALVGAVGAVCQIVSRYWEPRFFRRMIVGAAVLLALAAAAESYHRGKFYEDEFTFLTQWLRSSQLSARSHHSIGMQLLQQNRPEEAAVHFRLSLEIEPSVPTLHQLAILEAGQGRLEEAEGHLREAIELAPHQAPSHNHLGIVFSMQGRYDEAVQSLQRATDLDASYAEAYYNMGNALDSAGRVDDAGDAYRKAIELYPDYAGAHNNLGLMLMREGQHAEAAAHFERALQIAPGMQEAAENLERVREAMRAEQ